MKKTIQFLIVLVGFIASAQVSLVRDINLSGNSNPYKFHIYNNTLFFAADDLNRGLEPWLYNETYSATMLKNIHTGNMTGSLGLAPTLSDDDWYFITFLGNMYFPANDGFVGSELWVSDGLPPAASGTTNLFKDLNSGGHGFPQKMTILNTRMVFTVEPNTSLQELWGSDGTTTGTVLINNQIGHPKFFTEYNGKLYFSGDTLTEDNQLYVTDGTSGGTSLFFQVNSSGDGGVGNFIVFNNKLYFSASDGTNGKELWETDGTTAGTQLVSDLNPGSIGSNPQNLTIFNNRLYFTANHSSLGNELFYVGTSGNITSAANINSGAADSFPSNLTVFNGKLYFSATNGNDGVELWETSGTSFSTVMTKNINTSSESTPMEFTEYNGKLYFNADDGINGRELWVTDGTTVGTILVTDINITGDSDPINMIVFNNELFFSADDGVVGRELFKYEDPTLRVNDFENKLFSLYPNPVSSSFVINTKEVIKLVSVYDVSGKKVKEFESTLDSYSIDDLSNGMYFVKIQFDKGTITKKIIKE